MLENGLAPLRRDTDACIHHINRYGTICGWLYLNPHGHCALRRKLERIPYQIDQDLLELTGVGQYRSDRERQVSAQRHLRVWLRALQLFQHFWDQGVESDLSHLEIDLPRFNLREIEHSVDQAEEMGTVRLNTFKVD